MSVSPIDQARLWTLIVSSGLEEEYERDLLGRIKSRRTKRYLRAEISPELAQLLANTSTQVSSAIGNATTALAAAPENVRRLIGSFKQTNEPE